MSSQWLINVQNVQFDSLIARNPELKINWLFAMKDVNEFQELNLLGGIRNSIVEVDVDV